jgi:hypothetical protein
MHSVDGVRLPREPRPKGRVKHPDFYALLPERRSDRRAGRRAKSRWFSRDQALCVTTDSLAERLYAIQVCQFSRPLRQADSSEEGGRWLHIHPPDAP